MSHKSFESVGMVTWLGTGSGVDPDRTRGYPIPPYRTRGTSFVQTVPGVAFLPPRKDQR